MVNIHNTTVFIFFNLEVRWMFRQQSWIAKECWYASKLDNFDKDSVNLPKLKMLRYSGAESLVLLTFAHVYDCCSTDNYC